MKPWSHTKLFQLTIVISLSIGFFSAAPAHSDEKVDAAAKIFSTLREVESLMREIGARSACDLQGQISPTVAGRTPICTYDQLCKSFGDAFNQKEFLRTSSGAVIRNPEYMELKSDIAYCARQNIEGLKTELGNERIVQEALNARGIREKRLGDLRTALESEARENNDGPTLSWMKENLASRLLKGEALPTIEDLEKLASAKGMKPLSRESRSRLDELIRLQIRLAEPVGSTGLLDVDFEMNSDDLRYLGLDSDIFFETYPQLKEKYAQAQTESRARQTKMDALVASLKTNLVSKVRSYATESNHETIDNIVNRINVSEINFKKRIRFSCTWPNAVNNNGTLLACPEIQDYPDSVLTYLLGHELGHSIAPCSVRTIWQDEPQQNQIADLPYTKYPLAQQSSCLLKSEAAAARVVNFEREYQVQAADIKKSYAKRADGSLLLEGALQSLRKQMEAIGPCIEARDQDGVPQIEESMADWIGVELLAARMQPMSQAEQAEAFHEVSIHFAAKECPYPSNWPILKIRQKLADLHCSGTSLVRVERKEKVDPHLSAAARFEKILLAQPTIRKAAGCAEQKGPLYCE